VLKGIDISQYQTATPSLDGLSFIVLRASIGLSKDAKYADHYAAARAAGLIVMAYHYGYPDDSAPINDQVAVFLSVAADADFLWLDQEEAGFTDALAQDFINRVPAIGKPCGLYHSSSGFGGVNADAKWVADWRDAAVNAGYPLTADKSREFPAWDLWQWRGSPLDSNVANPARPLAGLLRRGYVAKTALDAAGIESMLRKDDCGGLRPHMQMSEGVELMVREADADHKGPRRIRRHPFDGGP